MILVKYWGGGVKGPKHMLVPPTKIYGPRCSYAYALDLPTTAFRPSVLLLGNLTTTSLDTPAQKSLLSSWSSLLPCTERAYVASAVVLLLITNTEECMNNNNNLNLLLTS